MATYTIGDEPELAGYVTFSAYVFGCTTTELETRIGYNPGALAAGYWFARLIQPIGIGDFELRGHTHFPDGRPVPGGPNVHDIIKARLSGHPIDRNTWQQQLLNATKQMQETGVRRVCKIIPVGRPSDYPPSRNFIPQYQILKGRERKFRIDAEVGPGQKLFRRKDDSVYVV